MFVELACQALLRRILPDVDPKRSGLTIDIGVGDCDFYFQLFDNLKFQTVAVEPLPTERVRRMCEERNIKLIESCISHIDGPVPLYIGTNETSGNNINWNSMRSDWLVSSGNAVEVPSLSLITLLASAGARQVTCLKMDVEGMEQAIIEQLQDLQETLLPRVLMFEYGGGGTRESERGGWSKEIFTGTMKSLEIIRHLGYEQIILVDLAPNTKAHSVNLKSLVLAETAFFDPYSIYGNIIALRGAHYSERQIAAICKPYEGDRVRESLFTRIWRKLSPAF